MRPQLPTPEPDLFASYDISPLSGPRRHPHRDCEQVVFMNAIPQGFGRMNQSACQFVEQVPGHQNDFAFSADFNLNTI